MSDSLSEDYWFESGSRNNTTPVKQVVIKQQEDVLGSTSALRTNRDLGTYRQMRKLTAGKDRHILKQHHGI